MQIIGFKCEAHRNIYTENSEKRELYIEIGLPGEGQTDTDTGMLILIPGYGGDMNSNIFRKMRETFCDEYNLVVMQCDYFGNRYMDAKLPENVGEFLADDSFLKGHVMYLRKTKESIEEFNDMGMMQALDIVNATLETLDYLEKNRMRLNWDRIILFGTSHGAYLAHLCNLICPKLYTNLIDISAYLKPTYLSEKRGDIVQRGNVRIILIIEQFINAHPEMQYHSKLYDLRFLYKSMQNSCRILAFQGAKDEMVHTEEKEAFIKQLSNAEIMIIREEDVDNVLVTSASHGLGMDFIQLFKMLMPLLNQRPREKRSREMLLEQKKVFLGDETASVVINYESGRAELEKLTFCTNK